MRRKKYCRRALSPSGNGPAITMWRGALRPAGSSPSYAIARSIICVAVPGVRKRLAKAESPEVRKRALEFLDRFDPATLSPGRLRQLRAVELLEGIATPAAKDLLSDLAKGAAGAPLTLEAAGALERLRGR